MSQFLKASLALLIVLSLVSACEGATSSQSGDRSSDPTIHSEAADTATSRVTKTPGVLRSLADLPVGRPPGLAYVVAGSSVVLGDRWVDLEWEVTYVVGIGSQRVLVYSAKDGAIHRIGRVGINLVTDHATSPPAAGGTHAWVENDREIVQQRFRDRERQPHSEDCCNGARVAGFDFDMDPDIFVVDKERAWLWDTYEGNEGSTNPAPDSTDYFWPIGNLRGGTLVDTGVASEVLVRYPNDRWGWGYVGGPRDPSSDTPASYREQQRVTAQRVWLTTDAIIALDTEGRLSILKSAFRDDGAGHHWRVLTDEVSALGLPTRLRVDGVVREDSRFVLIDATDESGHRAWVRCDIRSLECEVAAELGPDDLTPN